MSRFTHRLDSSLLGPILALAVAWLAIVAGPAAAGASDQQEEKYARSGGGFELFVTDPDGTNFGFKGDFAIPAGFFDKGSARFSGLVPLKGSPLRTFKGYSVGATDTIVEYKRKPKLGSSYPSQDKIELEVVALSLESVRPIQVQVGGKAQLWDVKLQLSPSRPSSGKATVVQRSERGGLFTSELTVVPAITFTRQGDGAERRLDLGAKQRGAAQLRALTLRAANVPWEVNPPKGVLVVSGLNGDFFVGASNGQAVIFIDKTLAAAHKMILTPLQTD